MKIKVVDKNNEIQKGVIISLELRNKFMDFTSDDDGIVTIDGAAENDVIKYYSNKDDVTEIKFSKNRTAILTINAPLKDMIFYALDVNSKPVADTVLEFRYLDKKIKKTSNQQGRIKLSNIPINTQVRCLQIGDKNEVLNEYKYKCESSRQEYEITLDMKTTHRDLKFVFKDEHNRNVTNTLVKFRIDGEIFEKKTNSSSLVLQNIKIGSIIECKQIVAGEELSWQKFKCKPNTDELVFYCVSRTDNKSSVSKTKQTMKFRLLNAQSHPIPNAVVKFEVGDFERNKYTNSDGEVETDELEIGEKFNVFVDLQGQKLSSDFIFQGESDVTNLVLKGNNDKYYILIGALFVAVLTVVAYFIVTFDYDAKNDVEPVEVKKKDTLIISNYHFKVEDKLKNRALKNSLVKLYYADTMMSVYTDRKGNAQFPSLANKLPVKYEVSKFGFHSFTQNQLNPKDSVFDAQIKKDTSIFVNEHIFKCNDVAKSQGATNTYYTYKMQKEKGSFKIWFNFYKRLHDIKVYSGDIKSIDNEHLIFSSEKPVKGIYNCPPINYESKSGLVTVCIRSKSKSKWVYKLYCAKKQGN